MGIGKFFKELSIGRKIEKDIGEIEESYGWSKSRKIRVSTVRNKKNGAEADIAIEIVASTALSYESIAMVITKDDCERLQALLTAACADRVTS